MPSAEIEDAVLKVLLIRFFMPGDHCGEVTPVPIPNTEVKLSYADDTASQSGGKVGNRQAFFCPHLKHVRP